MKHKPRLCYVGSFLGRNPGYITTQGQITADLFAAEDYEVTCVSSKLNRFFRLAEIVSFLIKNHRGIDLVLLEVYSGQSFMIADIASFLCRIFKLPLIMVLHGGNLPHFIKKYPRWTQRILRRADRLVAPSLFLGKHIGDRGFAVKVIPNVIELERYPYRERNKLSPRLVWMRSFHPLYNPEMAIRVLAQLRRDYPQATLTMAGVDKGLEPAMKELAAEMNLAEAVIFPGFLDANQKARIFFENDIYLNTNHIDNMPVAVLEACAFGLPVVATNVGGLPFLICDGETGLLVENDNANEMVEAVKLLLEDSNSAQKLSRGGRRLAELSAWNNVRPEWEKLFGDVLDTKAEKSTGHFAADKLSGEKEKILR